MAEQRIDIEYDDQGSAHKVTLTVRSLDPILEAAKLNNIRGKEGEELVAALIDHRKGNVSGVFRIRDGVRNDGANGEPQSVEFYPDGTPERMEFAQNGQTRNGPQGEPALQFFHPNGRVRMLQYRDENGMNDTPRGDPAAQEFDDTGKLVRATRYKNNQILHHLSKGEVSAYISPADRDKMNAIQRSFGDKLKMR